MPLTLLSFLPLNILLEISDWTWANVKFYGFVLLQDRKVKFLCASGLGFRVDMHVYCSDRVGNEDAHSRELFPFHLILRIKLVLGP